MSALSEQKLEDENQRLEAATDQAIGREAMTSRRAIAPVRVSIYRDAIAVPVNTIKAHAELFIVTEAASDVDVPAELPSGSVTGRELRQRFIRRAFRHDVDASTNAVGIGCNAQQHRARAFQNVNPLS